MTLVARRGFEFARLVGRSESGALGGTRTPSLLIRRYLRGRPSPFISVRGLGHLSYGCSSSFAVWASCSPSWLPRWLPGRAHISFRSMNTQWGLYSSGISLSGYGPMSLNPLARYKLWAAVMKSGLSRRTRS